LKVDERALMTGGSTKRRRRSQRRAQVPYGEEPEMFVSAVVASSGSPESRLKLESHCLGILMRRPGLVHLIDRQLQQHGLVRLSRQDFLSTDNQLILRLIEESLQQDHTDPLHYVLNNLPMPLMTLVDPMLEITNDLDPESERVLEDLVRIVLVLRKRHLNEHMEQVGFLMQEVQDAGDIRATEYLQAMKQGIQTRELLDKALGFYTNRALT